MISKQHFGRSKIHSNKMSAFIFPFCSNCFFVTINLHPAGVVAVVKGRKLDGNVAPLGAVADIFPIDINHKILDMKARQLNSSEHHHRTPRLQGGEREV